MTGQIESKVSKEIVLCTALGKYQYSHYLWKYYLCVLGPVQPRSEKGTSDLKPKRLLNDFWKQWETGTDDLLADDLSVSRLQADVCESLIHR